MKARDAEDELIDLVWAMQNDCLTSAAGERLAELVAAPHQRRRFIELVDLFAALEWEKATASGDEVAPRAGAARPPLVAPSAYGAARGWLNRQTPYSLITAAVLVIAGLSLLAMIKTRGGVEDTPLAGARELPSFVARVTGSLGCEWSEESWPLGFERHLFAGQELELRTGRAEITYYNGTQLLLEAPARFRVEDATGGFLHAGQVRGTVPPRAAGFTVATPSLVLRDLGTEFGMIVKEEGIAEVHVFSGEVAIDWRNADGSPHHARIVESQAVRVTRNVDRPERFSANPSRFAGHARPRIIAFQGFEEGDSWGYTAQADGMTTQVVKFEPFGPLRPEVRSGNAGMAISAERDRTAHASLLFEPVDISGFEDVVLRLRLAALSGRREQGLDRNDFVAISLDLDGAGFPAEPDLRLTGCGNAQWGYDAGLIARAKAGERLRLEAPQISGPNSNNYSTLEVSVPRGARQVAVRLDFQNNAPVERWAIDDVTLTETRSPDATPRSARPVATPK